MQFFYNEKTKNFRTKPLYTFIFCLIFIIIPGIILWLLFGYINYSGYFLIFPAYGHIASGNTEKIIHHLNEIYNSQKVYYPIRYASHDIAQYVEQNKLSGSISLANFQYSYISPLICALIIPLLAWSILLPFLAKFTKIINYDVITFSFTCAGLISVIILTGAIPVGKYDSNHDFIDISSWIILARIVISAVSIPFFFFIANKIVMMFIGASKEQNDYYAQLTKETLEVQKKELLMRNKRISQKQKNKEPVYVEIDEDTIKLRNKKKENNE